MHVTICRSNDEGFEFIWERFFTALLTQETKGTYLKYNKSELNKNYLNPKEAGAIEKVIREMTKDK